MEFHVTAAGSSNARMAVWLESAWLARYLERELSAEETEWFEAYVLDKPDLIETIEMDSDMREGLAMVQSAPREGDGSFRVREPRSARASRTRASRLLPATVASLLLGVAGGWIGERMLSDRNVPVLIANPTRIVFDTMRGESMAPRIEHGDSDSRFVLVEVAVPEQATDVSLVLDGEAPISLQPSPEGFVATLLQRRKMAEVHGAVVRYQLNGNLFERSLPFDQRENRP